MRFSSETRRCIYMSLIAGCVIILILSRKWNGDKTKKMPPALPPNADGGEQVIDPEDLMKPELWAPNKQFDVVPRFVHYVWIHPPGTEFRFHNYLSILSAHKFLQPDKIYLWCSNLPTGKYFDETKEKVTSLSIMMEEPPKYFNSKLVVVPEHKSEIVRLKKLIEYGGIYLDTDVIVLKPFSNTLFKYDATMPYYDSRRLNPGIILAKPKSIFIELWLFKMESVFDDYKWDYHATFLPAQVAARNKQTIHIEYFTMDSPHRQDKEEIDRIYSGKKRFDWTSKYVFHLWHRYFKHGEMNPENIKTLDSVIGEIFRYVYYGDSKIIK